MPSLLLRLKKITLDKNAQPRLALSADTINEYCEEIINGDEFPAVIVFKNGTKYYLADGFHRYKAMEKAGCLDIECEVKAGDLRDAMFFSLSANSKHGLNRTISDKRRAVMICLKDDEWKKKNPRDIASLCNVSHTFVYQMQADLKDKIERDKKANSGSRESVNVYKTPDKTVKKQQPKKSKSVGFDDDPHTIPTSPEGKVIVDKEHYEEMLENYESTLTENEEYEKVMSSEKPLQEAQLSIKKLTHEVKAVRQRLTGMTLELREAVRHVKSRDVVIKKQKQKMKEAGLKDF